MPGPRNAPDDATGDSPASLAAVVALLGASFAVMAVAVFLRRPASPKPAPYEMREFSRGPGGRIDRRLLMIAAGLLVLWLAIFVAVGQFRIEADGPEVPATSTSTEAASDTQPAAPKRKSTPRSDTYKLLTGATGVLLIMMVTATVLAAARNRTKLPPVVLTGGPDDPKVPAAQPLAVAAERGLAEVGNLALDPRAAIIACYAAMEQALAAAPGAAPRDSDTPSEVLARAVGNRTISGGSATALVELFAEARFSSHTMTEVHREDAERALRTVLDEVRSTVLDEVRSSV